MWCYTCTSCKVIDNCRGTTPFKAFFILSFIVAFSTTIGDVVRREIGIYDSDRALAYFLQFLIVFMIAISIHTTLFLLSAWGGGSLATKDQIEEANFKFYFTKKSSNPVTLSDEFRRLEEESTASKLIGDGYF
jgi:hypothetical protein